MSRSRALALGAVAGAAGAALVGCVVMPVYGAPCVPEDGCPWPTADASDDGSSSGDIDASTPDSAADARADARDSAADGDANGDAGGEHDASQDTEGDGGD